MSEPTASRTPKIRRWSVPEGTLLSASIVGWYVSYADHVKQIAHLTTALADCGTEIADLRKRLAESQAQVREWTVMANQYEAALLDASRKARP